MTQIAIQKQVAALIKVTREASKTKETARQFLIDAGIIREKVETNITKNKKK